MADISKIKLPNGSEYDLKDASKVGVYIVKGTQTKSTASWTGNINIPALYYFGDNSFVKIRILALSIFDFKFLLLRFCNISYNFSLFFL